MYVLASCLRAEIVQLIDLSFAYLNPISHPLTTTFLPLINTPTITTTTTSESRIQQITLSSPTNQTSPQSSKWITSRTPPTTLLTLSRALPTPAPRRPTSRSPRTAMPHTAHALPLLRTPWETSSTSRRTTSQPSSTRRLLSTKLLLDTNPFGRQPSVRLTGS